MLLTRPSPAAHVRLRSRGGRLRVKDHARTSSTCCPIFSNPLKTATASDHREYQSTNTGAYDYAGFFSSHVNVLLSVTPRPPVELLLRKSNPSADCRSWPKATSPRYPVNM